jgi:glycosyltransferase involved in cell wall biosynthesis
VTRVLFLAHAFPRYENDPVGSFILRLAVVVRSVGFDVTVLAPSGPGLRPDDTFEGIQVRRFRYAPRAWETLAYTGTMSAQVAASWKGKAAIAGMLTSSLQAALSLNREHAFELVHAHWWFPGGLTGLGVSRILGVPLVTTLHGSDIRLVTSVPGGRKLFRRVAGGSAAITTVSSWLAAQAAAIDPDVRPIVAPMPVPTQLFQPSGEHIADRLLFVGKLTEQKGLHRLLRAMALMTRPVTLDVVGAGRVDDQHLRDLAATLGIADRVAWHPLLTQSELAAFYARAAVHVIPAIDEGLGLTAVESLLSETPVVAFESGGVTDVVIAGESGVLVPPGDVGALAAALESLLADNEQLRRLGRRGREHALAMFGTDAVARQYGGIYRAALADAKGRSAGDDAIGIP